MQVVTSDLVADAFAPVRGKPSWLVKKGHGSFVTLEFGEPALEVRAPKVRPVRVAEVETQSPQRFVTVHGEWHLWIYCCDWSLSLQDVELCHNESSDETMSRALSVLNGQSLEEVSVSADASTKFSFDLGCRLSTRPASSGTYTDEPVDQWYLFEPSGMVLSLRGDGLVSRESGTPPQGEPDQQAPSSVP